ncbi:MAG: hypothetical protein ACLQRH_13800 [Acidimicrobiales bacterium]
MRAASSFERWSPPESRHGGRRRMGDGGGGMGDGGGGMGEGDGESDGDVDGR